MKRTILFVTAIASLMACNSSKKSQKTAESNVKVVNADTMTVKADPERPRYNESKKRVNDLLHTKLEVSFDYDKSWCYGKATLTLKPYFYSADKLELDARGFEIKEVSLVKGKNKSPLQYDYKNNVIDIKLDKAYTSRDTFMVFIDYISKPNELELGGSEAISSDKGLYFINPQRKDDKKPRQIWTQGETQSNSAWFPTIDSPNERMTDEIYMTVDKNDVTLSNGLLISQKDNGNGTRTDYWKMDMPHAPYLVMMAIGEFAVIKDKWRNKEVNYYIEKDYEQYGKAIFGRTPEMIEFYSKLLGVDYAWPKYHQIVVRDYVSGAMENTSATLHGEFLNKTTREMIDGDNDEIIAHELFHQWFGDLVTCESWANLPLNESFATYGEYLWAEHANGRDDADHHGQQQQSQYLGESRQKQVNMIRFDYVNREDMFDGHSYAKGGRILHMLRKYVGDEAFFKSLQLYLSKNKFTAVEIHNLRLAFEEVTGEDLNWFFNQWFMSSGHPDVSFRSAYDPATKQIKVMVEQKQNIEKTPLYKLPLDVDIYSEGKVRRERIVVEKKKQEFLFNSNSEPDLVNIDAEKMLLCTKKDKKTIKQLAFQYANAPLYLDRSEALDFMAKNSSDEIAQQTIIKALDDKYWSLRQKAIQNLRDMAEAKKDIIKPKLMMLAAKDPKSSVRASALYALSELYTDEDIIVTLKQGLKDSSYNVMSVSLSTIAKKKPEDAMNVAKSFENEKNSDILITVAGIYAEKGTDANNDFFVKTYKEINGFDKYSFIMTYTKYLSNNRGPEAISKGLPVLEDMARNSGAWWMRLAGIQAISELGNSFSNKQIEAQLKADELMKTNPKSAEIFSYQEDAKKAKEMNQKITGMLDNIKKDEKDKNVLKYLGMGGNF